MELLISEWLILCNILSYYESKQRMPFFLSIAAR